MGEISGESPEGCPHASNERFRGGAWRDALHPEVAALVDHPCGSLADPLTPRRKVEEFVAHHRAGAADDAAIEVEDLSIEGPLGPESLNVRFYRPRALGPLPVLIHFHGGAFVLGSPRLDDPKCVAYALGAACAVISVDYRLAPENRFPAALEDGFSTLDWVWRQGASYGLDPTRLAVGGSSAGGALAASVTHMARERGGPPIAFQLLIYPVLDDRMATASMRRCLDTPVFARHAAEAMWRHYLGDGVPQAGALAAPARAKTLRGLPPCYLEACTLDPLYDEDCAYAARLQEAGVPVELRIVSGAPHGYDEDYLGAPAGSRLAETMRNARINALRKGLGRSAR